MKDRLTQQEYEALLNDLSAGRARMQISRNLARRFFTHVSPRNVHNVTGQYIIYQHFTVITLLVIGVLAALACLVAVYQEFDGIAFLAVPLTGILWTVIAGFSNEMGTVWDTFGLYIAALILAWFLPAGYFMPLTLFATGLFFYRGSHLVAAFFLEKLLLTSFDAFEMMEVHIDIDRLEKPDKPPGDEN